jgi:TrwC relaxase
MLTIRAMSDGAGYSARHLQHSDYYAEGERVTGQWQGRGAEILGLAGEVQSEEFEAVRQGLDPQRGEFLRQRHSADRTAADGTTQSRGRNLYDFTISAPKSVSEYVYSSKYNVPPGMRGGIAHLLDLPHQVVHVVRGSRIRIRLAAAAIG